MDFQDFPQIWLLFALLSAFFQASRLAVTKVLSLDLDVPALTLATNLASLAVTLPLIGWYHDFPLHDPVYLGAVLAGGMLSGAGGWALTTAIARSDLSLVGPVMTLTPGMVVGVEWLLTGDLPGATGLLGLALLMAGGYLLSVGESQIGWHQPFRRLLTTPGSLYAIVAALCFAAASTFGRIGIARSDPLSFAVMVAMVNPLLLMLLFSVTERGFWRSLAPSRLRGRAGHLLLLGVLFALMRIADQLALSLALASYVMAVKRTSGMFAVLLGRWFFHEGETRTKLAASLLMLGGLFVLVY